MDNLIIEKTVSTPGIDFDYNMHKGKEISKSQ